MRILGEEACEGLVIAAQRGGVASAACDFGVRGEDFLLAMERAVPHADLDEFSPRILVRVSGMAA